MPLWFCYLNIRTRFQTLVKTLSFHNIWFANNDIFKDVIQNTTVVVDLFLYVCHCPTINSSTCVHLMPTLPGIQWLLNFWKKDLESRGLSNQISLVVPPSDNIEHIKIKGRLDGTPKPGSCFWSVWMHQNWVWGRRVWYVNGSVRQGWFAMKMHVAASRPTPFAVWLKQKIGLSSKRLILLSIIRKTG